MNTMKQARERLTNWTREQFWPDDKFVTAMLAFVILFVAVVGSLVVVTSTMALVRERGIKAAIMQTGLQARCDTSTYVGEKPGTGTATPPAVMLRTNAVNTDRMRVGYVFVTWPRLASGLGVEAYCNIAPFAVCSEPRARVEYVFDTTYVRGDTVYVVTHRSFSLLKLFKGQWIPTT